MNRESIFGRGWERRQFIASAGALGLAAMTGSKLMAAQEKPKLKKAVKYAMIKTEGSVAEKLELVKSLGFEGVEIDSPSSLNVQDAASASKQTGVEIHGVIDSVHWQIRLSDPDPAVRSKGREALEGALKDAKTVGASTVLLVPGKVSNRDTENFDQVWSRSQEEVRKVLPMAKDLNVKIAIEVVWNDFITKPEQLVKYIDEFNHPMVGAYFDCSNMLKYGVSSANWIRALGKRMLKFDFKGYSHTKKWVDIGEGDENWPEVLEALAEVGYNGWATAEVAGGDKKELQDVAERMNRVLGLS
jgi:hexulose-6-phosphate isomerase